MESRLANSWHMTVNEKKFIETAILSDLRVDGRRPFDYRRLVIEFGREDGSSEVQLGHTRVMCFVSAQLTQPYRDRPNEGSLSIFTEFSAMSDPSFEVGRPGESAVELGRIIDRGLRESRAVDTESLCVLSGKLVWTVRIDLHILDNGGNLVDAANIAALAALLTFRRPECTLGGEDGQEVILHSPEVREPLPLIIHHLPIAVTFAFFSDTVMMIDPTHLEEAVMGGRMTATLNTSGDICAIQKPGGLGVMNSVVMQCLRIASVKASDITSKIKSAVDSYNMKRSLSKIKRHPSSHAGNVRVPEAVKEVKEVKDQMVDQKPVSKSDMDNLDTKQSAVGISNDMELDAPSQELLRTDGRDRRAGSSLRGPSSWDPCSEGVNPGVLKASLPFSRDLDSSKPTETQEVRDNADGSSDAGLIDPSSVLTEVAMDTDKINSLEDAVKMNNSKKKKKKKKGTTSTNTGTNE